VNTLAVLYDLAPQGEQSAILRRVLAEGPLNCQPYFMHFVFNALAHAGLFDEYAVALMRRWQVDEETQSFPEMWGGGDMSHSWQCTPLYQLSARVLGVTPLAPGFTRIAIRPAPCGLVWAKGAVPTPHGPVAVSWECEDDAFRLEVSVPEGCQAEITIPAGFTHSVVMVNGQERNA